MGIFSDQEFFCQACGFRLFRPLAGPGLRVCDTKCLDELEWRKTLSCLGKDYYTKPKEERE